MTFQIQDKEKFAELVEDVKNNPPPADAPVPPDPSTAVEKDKGWLAAYAVGFVFIWYFLSDVIDSSIINN